ncbi:MAG: hypothetical protein ACREV3_01765 [Gammaproteobacteria bacterium]
METFFHLQGQLTQLDEQVDAFDERIGRLARAVNGHAEDWPRDRYCPNRRAG